MKDAYEYIDKKVRDYVFRAGAPFPVNIYLVQDFISRFAGNPARPGFFFTLNQDLFVERQYYNGVRPKLPGIRHLPTWFAGNSNQPLESERCVLPQQLLDSPDLLDGSGFYYVKLHGSSNWYASGQPTMVIGHSKGEQIASQPLLARYYELFQSVLSGEGRRLLCLGYSFSDAHVNLAIRAAVLNGLRLYVLSPESPENL